MISGERQFVVQMRGARIASAMSYTSSAAMMSIARWISFG